MSWRGGVLNVQYVVFPSFSVVFPLNFLNIASTVILLKFLVEIQLLTCKLVNKKCLKGSLLQNYHPKRFQNDNIKDLYLRNVFQVSVRVQFPLFRVCGHFRLTMRRADLGRSLGSRKTTILSGPNMKHYKKTRAQVFK